MNTNCTHLWSLGHPLHTHRQAHVRLSKTPTSGRLDMPKSCGKFESGYKKHAYNSWGCLAFLTRSGWSPPHEFANGPYSANCTAAQLRLRNGYCLKHAQNRWRYDLLHKMSALNVCIVMQGGFKHELHAFVVAWAPTAHTPISPSLAEQNPNLWMAEHAEKLRKIRLWVQKACM